MCFIMSDPPHLIKKLSNAADASSQGNSRRLKIPMEGTNGEWRLVNVTLDMAKQAWMLVDPAWTNGLRKWRKLSVQVFEKDRFTKMRVYLAARAFGNSMVEVIDENRRAGLDTDGDLDAYYDLAKVVNSAWVCRTFHLLRTNANVLIHSHARRSICWFACKHKG
jgi:hypothetical protein